MTHRSEMPSLRHVVVIGHPQSEEGKQDPGTSAKSRADNAVTIHAFDDLLRDGNIILQSDAKKTADNRLEEGNDADDESDLKQVCCACPDHQPSPNDTYIIW